MFKIYFRNNGEQKEIILPEANLFSELIQEFNFPFDIEIVLCLSGNLGDEIFLDPRLESKMENEDKDRLNKIVAGKTFHDLNLCYVCIFNNNTYTIKSLLHELNHFNDLFKCSTDYKTPVEGGGVYIETSGYINNLICTHLNDFYAEYNSITRLIDLKYEDKTRRIDLPSIIDISLSYLKNNEKHIKTMIIKAKESEISDFEKNLTIIYSINHTIIKQFLYFLASYRAFHEKGFSNQLYEDHYNDFISKEIRPILAELLNNIKLKVLNANLTLYDELKDYLNEKISSFYKDNVNEYISELLKEKPMYPPLYNLQYLMSTINMGWINQMQTILDAVRFSLMSQLQAMMEPISRITNFFNIIPLFKLDNQEENKDDLE